MAAKFGGLEAQRKGFNNIIIEGDSAIVASAIESFPKRVDWRIHELIGDIGSALLRASSWKL